MAIYRKKKFTSPKKVGGPEIGVAHKSQKVGGLWPARLNRLRFSPVIMAIYRKKKFTSPKKVGGPEIGVAHKSQKVGGPWPARLNRLCHQWFWDGSGISWTICKQSAPRSRQITTPTPHHFISTGRMLLLTPNQQCQSTEGTIQVVINFSHPKHWPKLHG